MDPNSNNDFDNLIGKLLTRRGGYISRRSLLGRHSDRAGLAGCGQPSVPAPSLSIVERATLLQSPSCKGLHGYLCEGNCAPNANGNADCRKSDSSQGPGAWWLAARS